MAHCSFTDCTGSYYARWVRMTYLLDADEPVTTTFLACRDHDMKLQMSREFVVHRVLKRIGPSVTPDQEGRPPSWRYREEAQS
jgi:hypothetical protein